ncbi:hydrogenase maturation protease [Schlesneria paludicola]|uniref:hydrogenase maturation protease n=1 Tax=Schlesneria paludicola TaxID=360056 RepID=UPI000681094E|nr:hydrogenase maturation protease [Schlesneria paludicola]
MMLRHLLIAGIGNIFRGDDAFGCEVVQRLQRQTWPSGVSVIDYGIRGMDLAYALMDGIETTILVDATPQGGTPGTVYTMELDLHDIDEADSILDAHSMHPLNVLRMVRAFGGTPGRILLVGCEPEDLGDEHEGKMGLTPTVQTAIEGAIHQIALLTNEVYARMPVVTDETTDNVPPTNDLITQWSPFTAQSERDKHNFPVQLESTVHRLG